MRTALALLLCSISAAAPAPRAEDAVWIWPHAYRRVGDRKGEIFLLQKHFPKSGAPMGRGPSPHAWGGASIHLVFRLEREPDSREVLAEFTALRKSWERFGTRVAGLQLDYDSPTAKLGRYVDTVAALREALPGDIALSVTGLPDWFRVDPWRRNASRLGGVTIFYQLYRGKRAQPELGRYLEESNDSSLPFRVGLLEHQSLTPEQWHLLFINPNFRGTARYLGAK